MGAHSFNLPLGGGTIGGGGAYSGGGAYWRFYGILEDLRCSLKVRPPLIDQHVFVLDQESIVRMLARHLQPQSGVLPPGAHDHFALKEELEKGVEVAVDELVADGALVHDVEGDLEEVYGTAPCNLP